MTLLHGIIKNQTAQKLLQKNNSKQGNDAKFLIIAWDIH